MVQHHRIQLLSLPNLSIRSLKQQLSFREFEGVLHPVFEEDELKLILVGAALGTAVGVFQLCVMFGGG